MQGQSFEIIWQLEMKNKKDDFSIVYFLHKQLQYEIHK